MKRVIATGADAVFFGRLINTLGSVFKHESSIDAIVVYDLGLFRSQRWFISNIRSVELRNINPFCDHSREIEAFAWKTDAIWQTLEKYQGAAVLWLDAGMELQRSLSGLFETVEQSGYLFNVTPIKGCSNCKIGQLTHDACFEYMGVEKNKVEDELFCNAGLLGFLSGHSASRIARDAREYAAIPEVIKGPRQSHRHDQSIYSILRGLNGLEARYWMFYDFKEVCPWAFLVDASQEGLVTKEEIINRWPSMKPYMFKVTHQRDFAHLQWIPYRPLRGWTPAFYNFWVLFKKQLHKIGPLERLVFWLRRLRSE